VVAHRDEQDRQRGRIVVAVSKVAARHLAAVDQQVPFYQ
jgi:hypothetical protein